MAICKVVKGIYKEEVDVIRLIRYIADLKKCDHMICGGRGIIGNEFIFNSPDFIAEQFLEMQRYVPFLKKRVYHIVISLSVGDYTNLNEIVNIAQMIIHLYPDYQSVYVVHENHKVPHIHIVFNNYSVYQSFKLSYRLNMMEIKQYVDEIIDYELGMPTRRISFTTN